MFNRTRINPKKKKFNRPFSPRQIDEFVARTAQSNIPQSTRRLFFTFSEESIAERGFYKADMLGGMGSGILLRYRSKYFLLTAYHVVAHTLQYQQNESPFVVQARNVRSPDSFDLTTLLYPRWHWDIRTLMPESHGDIAWNDVALIELFDPLCEVPDSEVVDLEHVSVVQRQEFFQGQMLIGSGYPAMLNGYLFGEADEFGPGLAQYTNIQRHHSTGLVVRGSGPNDFYFKPTDTTANHDSLNGMSGGTLVNFYPKAKKAQWAGMLKMVDSRRGAVQFIPAYAIVPILRRYAESKRSYLDPLALLSIDGISPKKREELRLLMQETYRILERQG
jgi:hypothetical protein